MRGAARTAALAGALAAAACLAACKSQWYWQGEHSELVTTYVVVHTDPPGAMVWFNGARQDKSPVRIPVEYEHKTEQYMRQGNLSPDWSPTQVFTHAKEEMIRHVYEGNKHTVSATLEGCADTEKVIELNGEAEFEVVLRLPKTPGK